MGDDIGRKAVLFPPPVQEGVDMKQWRRRWEAMLYPPLPLSSRGYAMGLALAQCEGRGTHVVKASRHALSTSPLFYRSHPRGQAPEGRGTYVL